MAIKRLHCPKVQNQLLRDLADGHVRVLDSLFDGGMVAGVYTPSDETIYITMNTHWNLNPDGTWGTVRDWDALSETLTHEGVHEWFGLGLTADRSDDPRTSATTIDNRDDAVDACMGR